WASGKRGRRREAGAKKGCAPTDESKRLRGGRSAALFRVSVPPEPAKRTGATWAPVRCCEVWRGSGGFGLDHDLDRDLDVGVQVHHDLGLPDHADRTLAHDHFRLLDR